jgi:hypothetical protein
MYERVRREWLIAQKQEIKPPCSDDCCTRRSSSEVVEFVNGSDEHFSVQNWPTMSVNSVPTTSASAAFDGMMQPERIDSRFATASISPSPSATSQEVEGHFSETGRHPHLEQADFPMYQYSQEQSTSQCDEHGGISLVLPTPQHLRYPSMQTYPQSGNIYAMDPISYPYSLGQSHRAFSYHVGGLQLPLGVQQEQTPFQQQQQQQQQPVAHAQSHQSPSILGYLPPYHQGDEDRAGFQEQYAANAAQPSMANWSASSG